MRCQACGRYRPTRYVQFHKNIGALVIRFHSRIEGELCKSCIHKYYWEYTLITCAIGWLGFLSFFLAPIILVGNTFYYLRCLSLPSDYPDGDRYEDVEDEDGRWHNHYR